MSAPTSRRVPYVQNARRITIKMLLDMTSGIYGEPALLPVIPVSRLAACAL